jgi:hypothetical protein
LSKKKKEIEQPEVITTKVTRVKRVYVVSTSNGVALDLHVDLACGGSTVLTGFTSFSDKWSISVLKDDIEGYGGKEKCSKEK